MSTLRTFAKNLIDRHSKYWVRNVAGLPIGADLRVDIARLSRVNVRTIFDVGANRGQTYTQFRHDFPDAMIHCFEPIRTPFTELSKVTAGDPRVICENVALGEAAGSQVVTLHAEKDFLNSLRADLMNSAPGAEFQTVKIETLDGYLSAKGIQSVDLLKIDTEGYELHVLKGASQSLSAGRVSLVLSEMGFVSSDSRHTRFGELAELMLSYGYHFYGMYDIYHFQEWRFEKQHWVGYANGLFVQQGLLS